MRSVWVVAAGLVLSAGPVVAQPLLDSIPRALRGPDVTTQAYGSLAGLLSGTVYAATHDRNGRLWIGTDDGAYSLEGSQFHPEALPDGLAEAQVRAVHFDSAGGRWFALRSGAYRYFNGQWTHYGPDEGVPGAVVYSITETRAIDGTIRTVLGASSGICYVDGTRCRSMPLPPALGHNAFMVASTAGGTGDDELWVISASGGAARMRRGAWTSFGATEGLTGTTAEDIGVLPTATGTRVVLVGSRGAFELQRRPTGREEFVPLANSPHNIFRVRFVTRQKTAPEVWVGTSAGYVVRWREPVWDTLRLEGESMRGQVTLIYRDTTRGAAADVFVSSRGDRLTKVAFNTATRVNLSGRASRDWVHSILPYGDAQGGTVIGMNAAGVVALDGFGRTRLLNDPLNPLVVSTSSAYWGPVRRLSPTAQRAPEAPQLIVSGYLGPVWYKNGRAQIMPMRDSTSFRRIRYLELFDGSTALVGTSERGLMIWQDTAWEPMPGMSDMPTSAVTSVAKSGVHTLYATGRGGVYAVTQNGIRFDSAKVPQVAPWMSSICTVGTADGPLLFAGGTRGTVAWRRHADTGAWRPLPRLFQGAVSNARQTIVSCDTTGRVFIGSANGLIVGQVPAADTLQWSMSALVSRESGLPSNDITVIGVPHGNQLWVGTEYGAAIVDLNIATLPPLAPLSLRVTSQPSGRVLEKNAELPSTQDQLRVDVWFDGSRRDSESQFDIQWQRVNVWQPGNTPATPEWTKNATRYITDINPGTYQLRILGRDFAGRETEALEWRITVRPPWWQSWPALLVYLLTVVAIGRWLYQWRINVLQRGTHELVQSERRLRASEGKFRALFDRAQDAHLLSSDGHVMLANKMAATLFGVDNHDALVGADINTLLPGWSSKTTTTHTPDQPTPSPTAATPAQDVMVRRHDTDVPVQVTTTAINIDDALLWHVVLRDLTVIRAAEREQERVAAHLRERQRLESLGTLAGGIAHDFNNLLGVIRGNAELAESSMDDTELTKEHLESIVDASDRARDLVKQILAFSHTPLPQQERVDLTALVHALMPLLRRMIPSNVHITLVGMETPHVVDGDPTQLQQVLLNLASNAEYAMRSYTTGVLTIGLYDDFVPDNHVAPTGAVVRLEVSDTGSGMSAEVQARVFEPFFTTKPTGDGTGLGLAVLHGVVQSHGGRVQLTSSLGVGTSLRIYFPASTRSVATPVRVSAVTPARPTHPFAGARLIVVDDEAQVGRVIEKALTRNGYVVRVFSESDAALAAITETPAQVDLVLTDQTMPLMTGDVLTEAIHQVDPLIPVLILTGFSHRLTPERIEEVGALSVLQKPIDLGSLERAVEGALAWASVHGRGRAQ
jgi:signal transduction histidine kinase/CheY-like chemotaxis protein